MMTERQQHNRIMFIHDHPPGTLMKTLPALPYFDKPPKISQLCVIIGWVASTHGAHRCVLLTPDGLVSDVSLTTVDRDFIKVKS